MRLLLSTLAMLSLLIAAVLVVGCVFRLGVTANAASLAGRFEYVTLKVNGGCVQITRMTGPGLPGLRSYIKLDSPSVRIAEVNALWGFRRESFSDPHGFGIKSYFVSFPFWVPILPCLLAPAFWIRRHRKLRKSSRGFEVTTE